MDALKIIEDFKNNNSMLWVENNSIKLFVSDNFKSQHLKELITKFKTELFELLNLNGIFSKKDFINKTIFKSSSTTGVLSFAQERLWFIEQYEEGTTAYHVPELYELAMDTDINGVKYALQKIVSRHEVLRSTIEQGEDQEHDIQRVHSNPLLIEEVNVGSTENYELLIKQDINRPFNLIKEYPLRVKFYNVISTSGVLQKTVLLLNKHHIASDGWSIDVFQRELFLFYEAYVNNNMSFTLPDLEIQYKDYARWQRSFLTGAILEEQLGYWKNKLAGYQLLEFPIDYARPLNKDYKGRYINFTINDELSRKLREIAQNNAVTLNSVFLSSIHILLYKYTGQLDIVTGSPTANRHNRQTENLIGFFVNTQVNRTQLNDEQNFEQLIKQVHKDQIEAQLYQDLPFEMLVNELGVERDPSRHPVFQIMYLFQNFGSLDKSSELQKHYIKDFEANDPSETELFDFSVFIDDSGDEIIGQFSYSTSLFKEDSISRLIKHYQQLLNQLSENATKPYCELSLLSDVEFSSLITDWNATEVDYPKNRTIHELFEEQVAKTPFNIALQNGSNQLTYKELNEKSNQLARHIRSQYLNKTHQELAADKIIALCLDRGLEMIVAILAVMKAGAAYLPIDPEYPKDRLEFFIDDAQAEFVLCQKKMVNDNQQKLPMDKLLFIDFSEGFYGKENSSNLPQYSKAEHLAYVIYTSGTTGKPKGVMLEHFSLSNRIAHIIPYSKVVSTDYHLFKTNYVFDASFFEMFAHLCVGAKLYVTNYIFDLSEINELLLSKQFTSLHLVPSQYDLVSKILNEVGIHKIYFSGEALTMKIVADVNDNIEIYNYYGPTELGEITGYIPEEPADASIIGKVFPNCRQYVLDKRLAPVPIGVAGELYVSGAGMARGYLNRAELTAERFIANPFASIEDKSNGYDLMYRTGDVVKSLTDGNLVYIGRNDDQVKIRGYRIELGEIENALTNLPGIKQSCVLAKETNKNLVITKYLVAYYVLENRDNSLTEIIMKENLSKVLPEQMIPSVFVAMESFPLTTNGKLDKRALPEPDFNPVQSAYVAPSTDLEKEVCEIWQNLLDLKQVGVSDDFFRLGGNSILAIQLSHLMSKLLGSHIKVSDVFKYKTIYGLLENRSMAYLGFENVEKEF